jgi:hypothetical protein
MLIQEKIQINLAEIPENEKDWVIESYYKKMLCECVQHLPINQPITLKIIFSVYDEEYLTKKLDESVSSFDILGTQHWRNLYMNLTQNDILELSLEINLKEDETR